MLPGFTCVCHFCSQATILQLDKAVRGPSFMMLLSLPDLHEAIITSRQLKAQARQTAAAAAVPKLHLIIGCGICTMLHAHTEVPVPHHTLRYSGVPSRQSITDSRQG